MTHEIEICSYDEFSDEEKAASIANMLNDGWTAFHTASMFCQHEERMVTKIIWQRTTAVNANADDLTRDEARQLRQQLAAAEKRATAAEARVKLLQGILDKRAILARRFGHKPPSDAGVIEEWMADSSLTTDADEK